MNRYNNLNGFRAFCAIGIALMHILANISPTPHLHNITPVIEWFTNFVFLFFIISSFSLCCGYYERIKTGSITLNCFYTKRYWRILPFFAFLSLIDIMIGFSKGSLFEAFMNCTLVFGLLPNNSLEVIGVGWFLGTVFLFYMLFPFFVFLMNSKKRAWFVLGITIIINILYQEYFFTEQFINFNPGRHNILYSAPYFVIGGLLYLYRKEIHNWMNIIGGWMLLFCLVLNIGYFLLPISDLLGHSLFPLLIVFTAYHMYALGSDKKWLHNKIIDFLSGISMEIYLCHMVMFRVVERLHLENYISDSNLNYVVTSVLTICLAICFAYCVQRGLDKLLLKKIA